MRTQTANMFRDEAAHDLERRFSILAGIVLAIGLLHWMLYHAAF